MLPGFDATALGNVIYQLKNAADAIGDLLNRLSTASSEYTSDWRGASRQQYDADFAELCSNLESLINKAYSLSSAMNSLAGELAQADEASGTGQ
jgi:WXG100 family type VII secretion target